MSARARTNCKSVACSGLNGEGGWSGALPWRITADTLHTNQSRITARRFGSRRYTRVLQPRIWNLMLSAGLR